MNLHFIYLLLVSCFLAYLSVAMGQAHSCATAGRMGCIGSCVVQNCATGSCQGEMCVCSRCKKGPVGIGK